MSRDRSEARVAREVRRNIYHLRPDELKRESQRLHALGWRDWEIVQALGTDGSFVHEDEAAP